MSTSLLEVSGIGPATLPLLAEHGIKSAEDLAGASPAAVTAVKGFSEIRAKRVIDAARMLLEGTAVAKTDKPKKPKLKADKPKKAKAKKAQSPDDEPKKKPKKKKGSKGEKKKKAKKDKGPKAEKKGKGKKSGKKK